MLRRYPVLGRLPRSIGYKLKGYREVAPLRLPHVAEEYWGIYFLGYMFYAPGYPGILIQRMPAVVIALPRRLVGYKPRQHRFPLVLIEQNGTQRVLHLHGHRTEPLASTG